MLINNEKFGKFRYGSKNLLLDSPYFPVTSINESKLLEHKICLAF